MLKPIFDFGSEESSILLYEGNSKLVIGSLNYFSDAEIKLELLPKANIISHAIFNDINLIAYHKFEEELSFSIDNMVINGFNLNGLNIVTQVLDVDWIAKSDPINIILNPRKKAKKIIFHIFNFLDFRGYKSFGHHVNGSIYRLQYIDFKWKKYNIRIQSLPETNSNIKALKGNGGYKLTQVASIEKQNGLISKEEQEYLQLALRYFLSFAKGSWINPTCSVGIDKTGEKIWYSFNSPDTEWKSLTSWFNKYNVSTLHEFFPLYMNLWESERWRDTFKEVIYWFLNANDGSRGVDAGLILSQTALERLSFEYVVYEKKLLSTKGFNDIRASDKFRLLFSSLNIPLDIPASLPALTTKAKAMNWLDAPHALTEIRNSLIHPEHKKHGKFDTDIFIEAHTLSLWYLEISILAICQYNGKYSNRLIRNKYVGTVEDMPWA